ncbi:hypothetical protein [Dickeya ananatis]|uniref:hypothetical protein n=1 Tax=Dickeya ananatis TaxID=3061286 RepID=UPI00388F6BCE
MQPVDELTILADGLHDVVRRRILRTYIAHMEEQQRHFAGFQTNQQGGFDVGLRPLLEMNLLNLGDSMEPGAYQVNSKGFERAVLAYYAQLWRLPSPYWGYLTAMGSTEGNLFALWNARDFLCGAATTHWPSTTLARYAPVVLYAERSHYSLAKGVSGIATGNPCASRSGVGALPD